MIKQRYDSVNPHRLYRNQEQGIITGVCAGIADYFDISKGVVRFLFVLGFLFNALLTVICYIILSAVLEKRPPQVFSDEEEETFWKGVSFSPSETFGELRYKFRTMNERLKKMEDYVTSSEFELENKYKNL